MNQQKPQAKAPKAQRDLKQKMNPLEVFRDLQDLTNEEIFKPMVKDMGNQVFGFPRAPLKPMSGELRPGNPLVMKDVYSGKREQDEKLTKQLTFERQLRGEEQSLVNRKQQELTQQIKAIEEEMTRLVAATPKLDNQLKVAAMANTVDANEYTLNFLTHLFQVIKRSRVKIENAGVWLASANNRGAKKGGNVWGQNYKKNKGKYLLSTEHYLQRSAG